MMKTIETKVHERQNRGSVPHVPHLKGTNMNATNSNNENKHSF